MVEIISLDAHNSGNGKFITTVNVKKSDTILDVKEELHKAKRKLTIQRQSIRLEQKSKGLKDTETIKALNLNSGDKIYVKDLGPQIGWSTVFFCEYAGPLCLYLWMYQRPWIFYGEKVGSHMSTCTKIAAFCWSLHYAKRLLETKFVHRFSHATMPLSNLFKNCSYYWGFTLYVAYHINHPLFTAPSNLQVYSAFAAFLFCEFGNFSIHLRLRNLRSAGSQERRIPFPTGNPMTSLFTYVSCPNYTYEFGAWLSFTVMTQCLPAAFFALCGFYQMSVWALGKQKNYRNEFPNYPRKRKAILPFLL